MSQDLNHIDIADFHTTIGHDLVEQALRITHAALGGFGKVYQACVRDGNPVLLDNAGEAFGDAIKRDAFKFESLATRHDSIRNLFQFCSRKDKDHMWGWL